MNLKTIPKTTGVVFIRKISSGTTPVRLKFQSSKMFRLKAIPFNIHTLLMMKCFLLVPKKIFPGVILFPLRKGLQNLVFCCTLLRKTSHYPLMPQLSTLPLRYLILAYYWTPLELNILNSNPSRNLVYGWLTQKICYLLEGGIKYGTNLENCLIITVDLCFLVYLSFKTKTASAAATGEFRFFRWWIKKGNLEFGCY